MTPHPEDDFLEPSLLDRYCAGTASAEENARIDVWFGAHPGWRVWYEQLRARLREGSFTPLSPEEYQSAWEETVRLSLQRSPGSTAKLAAVMPAQTDIAHVAMRTDAEAAVRTQGPRPTPIQRSRRTESVFFGRSVRRYMWSTTVALVAGIVVLVVGWTVGVHHGSRHMARASLAYTTGNGERATVTLPDGGTVTLNVASRLEVPADYIGGHHVVRLVGEGLFTVSHHEGAPLTVLVGGTAARVLGTSFVVRRYATDTATLVAVREGKVAVGAAVVTAAQVAEVGRMGVPHVRPSDVSSFTSFATGVLTVDGLPLPAAIEELDRWYDADIRLGTPSLATHRLRGEFPAGSLGDLAENLEFVLGVRTVRHGRVLTLFPKL